MRHRVNVTGILLASGQMAKYGEIVDENQLVDAANSIKEGFTIDADKWEADQPKAEVPDQAASDLRAKAKGK